MFLEFVPSPQQHNPKQAQNDQDAALLQQGARPRLVGLGAIAVETQSDMKGFEDRKKGKWRRLLI
jgi:hypothetical protein